MAGVKKDESRGGGGEAERSGEERRNNRHASSVYRRVVAFAGTAVINFYLATHTRISRGGRSPLLFFSPFSRPRVAILLSRPERETDRLMPGGCG